MTKASNRGRAVILAFIAMTSACIACAQTGAAMPAGSEGAEPFIPFGLPPARTGYAIFGRFASLPSFNSEMPRRGSWHMLPELAVSQVMTSGWTNETGTPTLMRYLDYETWSIDLATEFGVTDRLAVGADVRAVYLCGGVLDIVIDSYHGMFGFPDMGRSELPRNEVVIDLETKNGFSLKRDGPALLLSDPQIHVAARLADTRAFDLTLRIALNLPLGLGGGLAGTPGFQAAAGLYGGATLFSRLRLWGVFGGILPFDGFASPGPKPMVCGRFSALLDIGLPLSPFMDLSLKGSPVETDVKDTKDGTTYDFFALPEADLRLGFVWDSRGSRGKRYMAFAFQEDPFSNNSADVSFQLVCGFETGTRDG